MPRINSTSCNVTVISPQGMWKLLVSGCHLSTKADGKEEFGCRNMQDLKCDSPVSPANCTTAGSLGSNWLGTRLVEGRDFSGLFCRDPVILLITDMKLSANPFPLPEAGLWPEDEAQPQEQARDHHRHRHHHHHHQHHHVHHHPHRPHRYECGGNQP
ncbi:hypothetical protein M9H77_23057 [Catharanthus roseus]|uniref:Uncharacterized protein n=1 Tax=Catharanthus roseus TaxID=4058 RepID=A0ACC0AUD6_CATRO|nr:hypothetical protein M9H77_23057 [Catharanthus roseus]